MNSWPTTGVPQLPGRGPAVCVRDTSSGDLVEVGGPQQAAMYVCGITPSDATHIGHAATYVTFDLLHRAWRDAGVDVTYVQNVTDVDDPLLQKAEEIGEDWLELAERETAGFRDDMAALRVLPPEHYVGAVEAIPDIVQTIQTIRDRGATYELDGDIYFSVAAVPHLGAVSHLPLAEMVRLSAQRGGDPSRAGKKDPLDPLLWQAARPGEPAWDTAIGHGRPGWHVECAAIALHRLGSTIDVQGGGSDLVVPHHELGAAEAGAATGEWPFARAYVHQEMVAFRGEKMSKSLGNLVFVSTLRSAGVDPMAIRLALLAHHHGTPWEWTDADLAGGQRRLASWRAALARPAGPSGDDVLAAVRTALTDDLDSPRALAGVDGGAAGEGSDPAAPRLVRATVDALLGVAA